MKKPKSRKKFHFTEAQEVELTQIDELIFEYQRTKNTLLAEAILEKFAPIVNKYYGILAFGTPTYDKDTKFFIFLISNDPARRRLLYDTYHAGNKVSTKNYIDQTINYVHDIAIQAMSKEDILSELNKILLEVANKYKWKKEGVHFPGFVANYYRFLVKALFDRMTKDVTHKYPFENFQEKIDGTIDESIEHQEVDWLWIEGKWGNEIFNKLTSKEREVIKYKYCDKMSFTEISKKMYEPVKVIKEILETAVKKIRNSK